MSARRKRRQRQPRRRSRLRRAWNWLTIPRIWAIVSVLAVLVLVISLIAPVFTHGF